MIHVAPKSSPTLLSRFSYLASCVDMDRRGGKQAATGEVGNLEEVLVSNINPYDRCFLFIEHEGSKYIGCLLIDNEAFCSEVANLLKCFYNRPIAEIGSLDLSHTL